LIYAQLDSSRRGIVQGLRFGLLHRAMLVSLAIIWNYVTQPISAIDGMAEVCEYIIAAMIMARLSARCIGRTNCQSLKRDSQVREPNHHALLDCYPGRCGRGN
jgi:hypothetical protein